MEHAQPNLFPGEPPRGVPAIVIRIWNAIDEHYANPRHVEPPTFAELSRILLMRDPDKSGSESTVFREIRERHPQYFPEWPIARWARPPWHERPPVPARESWPADLWHDANWLITDVSLGWLKLFGYTSKDAVIGREVAQLIRRHPGPRYPVVQRWTDIAYLADGTPRRMTRESHTTIDGGSQHFTLEEPTCGAIHTTDADHRIVEVTPEWLALLRYERPEQVVGCDAPVLLMHRPFNPEPIAGLDRTSDFVAFDGDTWRGDGSVAHLRREVWRATVRSSQPDGFLVRFSDPAAAPLDLTTYLSRAMPTLAALLTTGAVLDAMDGKLDGVVHWCHVLAHLAHGLA